MRNTIRTEGLTKEYGDVTAVEEVDLKVKKASIYGFLGPNGAGKSTTMKLLTGLLKPSSGTATVAGTSIQNRDELVDRIGFAPERPPFYANLTGRGQLRCIADIRGVSNASETISTYLDRFSLREAENRRIKGYSKGMKQKLNIIQSVFHGPEIVFLDEPTSGLDPQSARKMRELLTELREDGVTVFVSTHILSVVEQTADRVGILYEGKLREEGPIEQVLTSREGDELEDVFLQITDAV